MLQLILLVMHKWENTTKVDSFVALVDMESEFQFEMDRATG